jgi:HEAT repeat protein
LSKGDFKTKLEALQALRKHGANAKSAVPILIKILEDKKAIIAGVEAAVAEQIIPEKEDANPNLRASSAAALGAIGPDAKPAIPALLANLKDKAWNVRTACAEGLAKIGVKDKRIISAVKDAMLAEKDDTGRVDLAESLAELDPDSDAAISAVTKVLLKGDDPGDRGWAALALMRIKSSKIKEKAIPALIVALKDWDEHVRWDAAYSLGRICEESETVVPALVELLKDESTDVRKIACQSLGEFGPEAKAALPALTHAVDDPNNDVRVRAAQSLEQIKTWPKKRGQKGMQEQAKEAEKRQKEIEERIRRESFWPWARWGRGNLLLSSKRVCVRGSRLASEQREGVASSALRPAPPCPATRRA